LSRVRAAIIRVSSGRHDPQFVPALSRAPTASVEHAPSAIAAKMARDLTPKHVQILGLASKSADTPLPARRKRRAVPSSRPSRQPRQDRSTAALLRPAQKKNRVESVMQDQCGAKNASRGIVVARLLGRA
jgi:hypothetical protein